LNLGDILNNSFEYTKKLFSNWGRLVILIILDIIPIVNLIAIGYFAKVVHESPSSEDVPKLERYGNLFVQGLKIAIALVLYMIIPLAFVLGGVAFVGVPWMMRGAGYGMNMWAMNPLGIVLIIIGIIVAFFIAIVAAIGIVHMIKLDRFGKAFAFGEILQIIGKIGWGRYVAWIIIMIIISMIVGGIGAIPYVGWLISLIISPVFGVFAARSASLIYTEAAPPTQYPPPPPTAPVTTSATKPSPLYCKFCGAPSTTDAVYCQNCGQKMQ
jgi:hypothetical protein